MKLYGQFSDVVGDSMIILPNPSSGETVGDVLNRLAERFPGMGSRLFRHPGELQPYLLIAVGGLDIRLSGGLSTPVHGNDEVMIFPPGAGEG